MDKLAIIVCVSFCVSLNSVAKAGLFDDIMSAEWKDCATNDVDVAILNMQIAQIESVPRAKLYTDARLLIDAKPSVSQCCASNSLQVFKMCDWRCPSEDAKSNLFAQVSRQLRDRQYSDDKIDERYRQVLDGLSRRTYVCLANDGDGVRVKGLVDVVSENLRHCLVFGKSGNLEMALIRKRISGGVALFDTVYLYSENGLLSVMGTSAAGAKIYCRKSDGKWMSSADDGLKNGVIDRVRSDMAALLDCE